MWGWGMHAAWQGFTCDAPSNAVLWASAACRYFHSKFSQNMLLVRIQGKSLYYGPKLLTSAESHPGARCYQVPKLVNCNIPCTSPFATIVPVLRLVTVKATVNELYIIMHRLQWNVIISGKQTIRMALCAAVGSRIKAAVLVLSFLVVMNTGLHPGSCYVAKEILYQGTNQINTAPLQMARTAHVHKCTQILVLSFWFSKSRLHENIKILCR